MESEELSKLIRDAVKESLSHEDEVLGKEELRDLMHEAVVDAMSTLGIDARSPMDVQKDMQFMRELRLTSEKIRQKGILTLVGLLVVAGAGAIWVGIKHLAG